MSRDQPYRKRSLFSPRSHCLVQYGECSCRAFKYMLPRPSRRDRLGVVTQALFAQRDFSDLSILDEFHDALESSVRSQLTESGLYMGESRCLYSYLELSTTYSQVPACKYRRSPCHRCVSSIIGANWFIHSANARSSFSKHLCFRRRYARTR